MQGGRKRRTRSDADVSNASLAPNPLSNVPGPVKRRKESTARQAKLVPFPVYGMSRNPSFANGLLHNSTSYQMPPYPMQFLRPSPPAPKFTSNSIFFSLPPAYGDLLYTFSIALKSWQVVILTGATDAPPIRFAINSVLFDKPAFPVDVTAAIVQGENRICFNMEGVSSTIFVEMDIQNGQNSTDSQKKIQNIIGPNSNTDDKKPNGSAKSPFSAEVETENGIFDESSGQQGNGIDQLFADRDF